MFARVIITFLLVFAPLQSLAAVRTTSVVKTDSGPVRGKILKTVWNGVEYSAFKGMRYARAPIGKLRFKPPVEPEPWTNVFDAFEEPSECPQMRNDMFVGNEDCLFLNVYSPETRFRRDMQRSRPVMVWLYGGSFEAGQANASMYGPDFLLEDGVVFVSLNYRIGALGFLSLQNANVSGNAGLKDQNLALKWVQRNIGKFGGNPNLVTLFGQSAGATCVELHRLSPRSKGLFHRTISMSGSTLSRWALSPPNQSLDRAFSLGQKVGLVTDSVDQLYDYLMNLPAAKLVNTTFSLPFTIEPQLDVYYKPTIEDPTVDETAFLTECPMSLLVTGSYSHVPHMMGFTKYEAMAFVPTDQIAVEDLAMQAINATRYTSNDAATRVLHETVTDLIKTEDRGGFLAVVKIFSDIFFNGPIDLTQRLLVLTTNEPVFYYRQSYETEYSVHKRLYGINLNGTTHTDDVGYIFNMQVLNAPKDQNHPFNQYRKKMVRLFTNFAKYGNPTPNGARDKLLRVNWRPSDLSHGWQLEMNDTLQEKVRSVDRLGRDCGAIICAIAPLITGCKNIVLCPLKLYRLLPWS